MTSDNNKSVRPLYIHRGDRECYHWLKDRYLGVHHEVKLIAGGFTIRGDPDLADVDSRLKLLIYNKENEECDEFAVVDMDAQESRHLLWELRLPEDNPLTPVIRKAHYSGSRLFLRWDPKKTRWVHYASDAKPWISFLDVQDNELMRLQL